MYFVSGAAEFVQGDGLVVGNSFREALEVSMGEHLFGWTRFWKTVIDEALYYRIEACFGL